MARILFIDDSADARAIGRATFRSTGHEVTEATNGVEGMRLYRERPFDLVVTDIFMPEKDGLQTIQELRHEFGDVRIIAISGGSVETPGDYLPLAKRLGANEVFHKPINVGALREAAERVLKE